MSSYTEFWVVLACALYFLKHIAETINLYLERKGKQ